MAGTTERPIAMLRITWDANTGNIEIKSEGASPMELIGVLENAKIALLLQKPESRIVPAGPIMPHLIKQ